MNKLLSDIDTTSIINPIELLVYYLYKLELDKKNVNKDYIKKDLYLIQKYMKILGI